MRSELAFSAQDASRAAENLRLVIAFWEPFISVPFDDSGAECYGAVRAELKQQGRPIGANDLFIAASALAREFTLATYDTR